MSKITKIYTVNCWAGAVGSSGYIGKDVENSSDIFLRTLLKVLIYIFL